jgi:hypothetical protein
LTSPALETEWPLWSFSASRSGWSVSSAGDVNGDDLDDLIVGAWDAKTEAGKSYVVFGKANSSAINLSAIADASNPLGGFVINGNKAA